MLWNNFPFTHFCVMPTRQENIFRPSEMETLQKHTMKLCSPALTSLENSDSLTCINSRYTLIQLAYRTEKAPPRKRDVSITVSASRAHLGHSSLKLSTRHIQHLP